MAIRDTIQDWLIALLGFDDQHVIEAFQDGPRPSDPYATYYELTGRINDFSEIEKTDLGVDDDIEVTYRTPEEIVFSVDIYSAEGRQLLSGLAQSGYLLQSRQILSQDNLVLRQVSDLRSIPIEGDTRWRRRYQADFTFATYQEQSETNQKILEYELFGELDGDSAVIDV